MKRAHGFEVSLWFDKICSRDALAQRGSPICYNLWKSKLLSRLNITGKRRTCSEKAGRKNMRKEENGRDGKVKPRGRKDDKEGKVKSERSWTQACLKMGR